MSSFIALIFGFFLLFTAISFGGPVGPFIDPASLILVLGGVTAAMFASFQLTRIIKVSTVILNFLKKDEFLASQVIGDLVKLSLKARQQSLLALEDDMKKQSNRFIRLGLEMAIDGSPGSLIREVLETELDFIQVRHRKGAAIFKTAAKYSPAFGLLGTLIGLVQMLRAFGAEGGTPSMSGLANGMSLALITTFYGSILANMVFSPIAEKLKARTEEEVLTNTLAIEGIVMLQAGANPRVIERKLNSFLPPQQREAHYDKIMKRQRG